MEESSSNKRQVQDILSPDSPQQSLVKKHQKIKGTSGLQNLGNTCFMNSALQCLTNTTPLTKFFLTGEWESQVNEDNPLGMKGQIPRAYADLVHNMWGPNQSYAPRLFKRTIGERNPTFVGYGQQDSHELLQSLLDGLHEDLNRIKKREYVEDPEMGDLTEDQFAKLSWEAYIKRNDSIIVDLFQAQLKSRTECINCGHVSIKFDPFMYLQLPIPEPTHANCEVTVMYKSSSEPSTCKPQTMKFRVPKRFSVGELKLHVAKQLKWSANAQTSPMYSICADVFNSAVFKIFKDSEAISEFGSNDKIFIYELDEVEGKFYNQKVWKFRTQGRRLGLPVEHKLEGKAFGVPSMIHLPSLAFEPIPESKSNEELGKMIYGLIVKSARRFTNSPLFRKVGSEITLESLSADKSLIDSKDLSKDQESDEWEPIPDLFVVTKGVKSGYSSFGEAKAVYPIRKSVTADGARSPKSEVSELAQNLDQNELKEKDVQMAKTFFFKDTDYFFAEWKLEAVQYLFDGTTTGALFEPLIVRSEDEKEADYKPKTITVQQCMDEFTKEEVLDGNDTMYCSKCKEHQPTKKKLTVYSTPDILVIHLKRFSSTGRYGSRSKLEDFVDAPINGLDMSKLTTSAGNPEDKVYDLFAVSNHFGGLGGGHYTAYIKNPLDGEWYDCDDSRVTLLDSKVMTKAAYLLFYKRRNMPFEDITTIVQEANEKYQEQLREKQSLDFVPQMGLNSSQKYTSTTSTAVPSLANTRANSDAGDDEHRPTFNTIVPFGTPFEPQSTGFSFAPSSKIDEASSEIASFGTERENSPEPSDSCMEVDQPIREWPSSDSAIVDHGDDYDHIESFNTTSSESWEKIERE
ncbi:Ubiquitin carboxyl-terminal hydrolase 15 [Boothiomyces macroporosus]|uniref:Ubiquitin carboxyl-terminal hydrolase n=1 Tax=Boothiomyces macroporosus TaxID=261099 RepID=A0AAD5UFK0_9FUNG|nr:Ubiquitin carboxyl-terminal hydrolase 15 [Boothiomyces macroporosus]